MRAPLLAGVVAAGVLVFMATATIEEMPAAEAQHAMQLHDTGAFKMLRSLQRQITHEREQRLAGEKRERLLEQKLKLKEGTTQLDESNVVGEAGVDTAKLVAPSAPLLGQAIQAGAGEAQGKAAAAAKLKAEVAAAVTATKAAGRAVSHPNNRVPEHPLSMSNAPIMEDEVLKACAKPWPFRVSSKPKSLCIACDERIPGVRLQVAIVAGKGVWVCDVKSLTAACSTKLSWLGESPSTVSAGSKTVCDFVLQKFNAPKPLPFAPMNLWTGGGPKSPAWLYASIKSTHKTEFGCRTRRQPSGAVKTVIFRTTSRNVLSCGEGGKTPGSQPMKCYTQSYTDCRWATVNHKCESFYKTTKANKKEIDMQRVLLAVNAHTKWTKQCKDKALDFAMASFTVFDWRKVDQILMSRKNAKWKIDKKKTFNMVGKPDAQLCIPAGTFPGLFSDKWYAIPAANVAKAVEVEKAREKGLAECNEKAAKEAKKVEEAEAKRFSKCVRLTVQKEAPRYSSHKTCNGPDHEAITTRAECQKASTSLGNLGKRPMRVTSDQSTSPHIPPGCSHPVWEHHGRPVTWNEGTFSWRRRRRYNLSIEYRLCKESDAAKRKRLKLRCSGNERAAKCDQKAQARPKLSMIKIHKRGNQFWAGNCTHHGTRIRTSQECKRAGRTLAASYRLRDGSSVANILPEYSPTAFFKPGTPSLTKYTNWNPKDCGNWNPYYYEKSFAMKGVCYTYFAGGARLYFSPKKYVARRRQCLSSSCRYHRPCSGSHNGRMRSSTVAQLMTLQPKALCQRESDAHIRKRCTAAHGHLFNEKAAKRKMLEGKRKRCLAKWKPQPACAAPTKTTLCGIDRTTPSGEGDFKVTLYPSSSYRPGSKLPVARRAKLTEIPRRGSDSRYASNLKKTLKCRYGLCNPSCSVFDFPCDKKGTQYTKVRDCQKEVMQKYHRTPKGKRENKAKAAAKEKNEKAQKSKEKAEKFTKCVRKAAPQYSMHATLKTCNGPDHAGPITTLDECQKASRDPTLPLGGRTGLSQRNTKEYPAGCFMRYSVGNYYLYFNEDITSARALELQRHPEEQWMKLVCRESDAGKRKRLKSICSRL